MQQLPARQREHLPARQFTCATPPQHNINNAMQMLGDAISYYKIQQQDKNGYNAGDIIKFDEGVESVEFVWMATTYSRVYFPSPKDSDQRIICKSRDGKSPSDGRAPLAGPCEMCPKAQWDRSQTPNEPPKCSEVWSMMGWDTDEDMPFILQVKRTGVRQLKQIATRLKFGAGKYSHPGISAFYCVTIKLEVSEVVPSKGPSYFVPKFSIASKLDDDQARIFSEMASGITLDNVAYEAEETAQEVTPPAHDKTEIWTPDINEPGWEQTKVEFKKTGDMTWYDLAANKNLPDGTGGRSYLHKLEHWQEHPEIVKVASAALKLHVGNQEYFNWSEVGSDDTPPF